MNIRQRRSSELGGNGKRLGPLTYTQELIKRENKRRHTVQSNTPAILQQQALIYYRTRTTEHNLTFFVVSLCIFGRFLGVFLWKICLNNRFKSPGELFRFIWAHKIPILLSEGPKPNISMISGFWNP